MADRHTNHVGSGPTIYGSHRQSTAAEQRRDSARGCCRDQGHQRCSQIEARCGNPHHPDSRLQKGTGCPGVLPFLGHKDQQSWVDSSVRTPLEITVQGFYLKATTFKNMLGLVPKQISLQDRM